MNTNPEILGNQKISFNRTEIFSKQHSITLQQHGEMLQHHSQVLQQHGEILLEGCQRTELLAWCTRSGKRTILAHLMPA